MSDAPPPDELVFECDLAEPPEKVWRAIATPELRAAWLGDAEAAAGEVVDVKPGERLELAWPRDGAVSFEIAPSDAGGTRLRIVHTPPAATTAVIPFPGPARVVACAYRKAA